MYWYSTANYDSTAVIDDGSCAYSDCAGIVGCTATIDDCGVCRQAYIAILLHML